MPLRDVSELSDDEPPALSKDALPTDSETKKGTAKPKKAGKAKAKPKSPKEVGRGRGRGRSGKAMKRPASQGASPQKKGSKEEPQPTTPEPELAPAKRPASKEEPQPMAPEPQELAPAKKATCLKRPAAANLEQFEGPAAPAKIYKYRYSTNGTWGFKVNGREVIRVPKLQVRGCIHWMVTKQNM